MRTGTSPSVACVHRNCFGTLGRTYDVSLDGQRFLKIKATGTDASAAPPALIVVQHWDEELKRLVLPK